MPNPKTQVFKVSEIERSYGRTDRRKIIVRLC